MEWDWIQDYDTDASLIICRIHRLQLNMNINHYGTQKHDANS